MAKLLATAIIDSEGNFTLPERVREALQITGACDLAFELRDGEVVVSRTSSEHEDPAIRAYLALLDRDIRAGRNLQDLPESLVRSMLEGDKGDLDCDEDIEGDVAL
ncbi:MAG: type II toxin-antitoxin system PrlF family antitoxin [Lysobacteraceae bacterium]